LIQFQNPKGKYLKEAKSIPLTHKYNVHDHSLSKLGTGTAIKSKVVKLVLWDQNNPS
jgi:hypothetical protein